MYLVVVALFSGGATFLYLCDMREWLQFRKIKDWAKENAGATDCSKECATCKKTWAVIVSEGRGDEYVNMRQLPAEKKTPCGNPFEFHCDQCYLTEAIL